MGGNEANPGLGPGPNPSDRLGLHPSAGPWLVAGAAFFWGTSATLARYVFRDLGVPPLTAVELRLFLAAGMLGLYLAIRSPHHFKIDRRDWPALLVVALPGLAAVQGTYYYSISVLGVGLAILLQYLAPCLLVSRDLLLGRHIERSTLLAIGLALAGTALLLSNIDPKSVNATPLQWGIGFLSAFAFAFYIVSSKRLLRRYPPSTTLFYTFCIAGVFWAIVTPPWKILAANYGARHWVL